MKPKQKSIIAIIIFILIPLLLAYMWPFSKKPPVQKIVETKTFSCPGMSGFTRAPSDGAKGFTFEYPVFEGWEVKDTKLVNKDTCVLSLDWPDKNILPNIVPHITVNFTLAVDINKTLPDYTGDARNPHGIDNFCSDDSCDFWPPNGLVNVEIFGVDKNLSDLFFQTVIKSFRVTK